MYSFLVVIPGKHSEGVPISLKQASIFPLSVNEQNFTPCRPKDHKLLWSHLGKHQPSGSSGLYLPLIMRRKDRAHIERMEHTVWIVTPPKVSPLLQVGLQHLCKKKRFFCSLSNAHSRKSPIKVLHCFQLFWP